MRYIKLLDRINRDTVIKIDGRTEYEYTFRTEKWEIIMGIMIDYMSVIGDLYGKYEEISEEEAFKLIEKKRKIYRRIKSSFWII